MVLKPASMSSGTGGLVEDAVWDEVPLEPMFGGEKKDAPPQRHSKAPSSTTTATGRNFHHRSHPPPTTRIYYHHQLHTPNAPSPRRNQEGVSKTTIY
jgi:hypothetical protein